MLKAGSFEAYYEKFPGLAAELGVEDEFLKERFREAYILAIKPAPKPKVQKQSTAKPAVQATRKATGEAGSIE